jgi:hypothetical protein
MNLVNVHFADLCCIMLKIIFIMKLAVRTELDTTERSFGVLCAVSKVISCNFQPFSLLTNKPYYVL